MSTSTLGEVSGEGRGLKIQAAVAVLLFSVYLFQMVGPLRLNPDAVVYLSMAASAAEGRGFLHQGSQTHFPVGYPVILFALDRAGVGGAWAIIGLNCLFMAIGLAASFGVLRRGLGLTKRDAGAVCCLTLLCSVFINNIFMPMSDAVFFGLSMSCLLLLLRAQEWEGAKRRAGVVGAAVLIAASILIRTIGVALLLVLVWVCLSPQRESLRGLFVAALKNRARLIVLSAVACAALAGAGLMLSRTMYFRGALKVYADGGARTAITLLNYRAKDWGELAANMRIVELPTPVRVGLKGVGLAALAVVVFGLWRRRREFGAVEIYVSCVALILLVWPYTDGRFWIPIAPLMMGLLVPLFRDAARRAPGLRFAAAAYLLWFILAGVIALASNTRETLSRPRYETLDADTLSVVRRFSH